MERDFTPGDAVLIPWGVDEVRGTVAEVYGSGLMARVVITLKPEESGYIVDEETTVTMPLDAVRHAFAA